MQIEPLIKGNYFHIYNRGNDSTDLFLEEENYRYFLKLYGKYIDPVADTFAWCLMKNHFYVLEYLKEDHEIDKSELFFSTISMPKEIHPSKQFLHFFNPYTKAISKRYKRTGSLFEKPFERKKVKSEPCFSNLVFYSHNNPVHHEITKKLKIIPGLPILSSKPTKLKKRKNH